MNPVTLPAGPGTITVTVGAGGGAGFFDNSPSNPAYPSYVLTSAPTKGNNSTIIFSNGSITPIIAWGGGSGAVSNARSFGIAVGTGGSGGGGVDYPTGAYGQNNSTYNNFSNFGTSMISVIAGGGNTSGAGGGAGTTSYIGAVGGNGIQCFLPGISTFAPSGVAYGTYYWGGGGGANIFAGTAAINVPIGNGGLGGGGGGTITSASLSTNQLIPQGGGSALNSGGVGSYTAAVGNATAGSGGANTGGGGGGTAYGYAGSGGSGIVVLAFPQTAVATDVSAVLSPLQLLDASNIPVLSNPALSSVALSSIKGGFSCKLINASYFGPTMTLRHSNDACGNYTQNFYADVYGNLYTGYGNTGSSVYDWLNQNSPGYPGYFINNTTGAAITGWTTVNNFTLSATGGSRTGVFSIGAYTSPNYIYYYGPIGSSSFLNKTITFDLYGNTGSILNVFFGCNSAGVGTFFRLDFRGAGFYTGFANTTSWTSWGAPSSTTGMVYGAATTWISIKIVINSVGVATWFYSTSGQNSWTQGTPTAGYSINNQGNYMAFHGDVASGGYFSNISVVDATTPYAYVTKWYSQGMDICFNSATQYVLGSQPIYDVASQLINFGYTGAGGGVIAPQTNAYFNLPNGAFPYGDSSYSYILRHGNYYVPTSSGFTIWFGTQVTAATNTSCYLLTASSSVLAGYNNSYYMSWSNDDFSTPQNVIAPNNVVTTKYTSSGSTTAGSRATYVNGTLSGTINTPIVGTGTPTTYPIHYQPANGNYIGTLTGSSPYMCNSQMYNFYYFSTALSDSDRQLIEGTVSGGTPYVASTAMTLPAGGHAVGFTAPPSGSVFTISNIAYSYPLAGTMVNGTSVSNNITYNVYSFTAVGGSYTLTYTLSTASYIYVLAVGGGGGGVGNAGGGGGAGGVVMNPVYLSSTASPTTITITLGAGGFGNTVLQSILGASNGGTTTVSFSGTPTPPTIYAYGGGSGGMYTTSGIAGGSSGGTGLTNTFTPPNTNNNNYANTAGLISGGGGGSYSGGGGGAGTMSATGAGTNAASICAGGNGIQCFLPGISTFAPAGTAYGTYYWGGGGGGSTGNGNTYAGNGGLGGGGGASTQTAFTTGGVGGGSALNPGGQGGIADGGGLRGPAGGGGANTGGGGGGSWNGYGGYGGSGIVIIAFPQTAITSNAQAILTPAQYASGSYNDVMTMTNATYGTAISSTAYNSAKGAYACRLINYNYFGPIMTLRHTADPCGNSTANFYADVFGNFGTGYLGTGTSLSAWLIAANANTTYAYVTKWYSQSMDVCFNSATQYTLGSQPIFDYVNGVINFGYTGTAGGIVAPQTNCYFNLPNAALPYGDSSYSLILKNWNFSGTNNYFVWGGTNASNGNANTIAYNSGGYQNSWQGYNVQTGTYSANTVVSSKYTAGSNGLIYLYVNDICNSAINNSARSQVATGNYIEATGLSGWGNSQLYYLYVFGTALSDTDRYIMEGNAGYVPALSTVFFNVTMTIPTASTTATLTWNAIPYASVNYYKIYLNNAVYASNVSNTALITSYTVNGITTSGINFVSVVGYNSVNTATYLGTGSGSYTSTPTTAVTVYVAAPTPFSNIASQYSNANGFTLTWTGGSGTGVTYSYAVSAAGSAVTGYTVYGTNPSIFYGLSNSNNYYVVITATNSGGTSTGTYTVVNSSTSPSAITGVSASNQNSNGFTINWTGGSGTNVSYTFVVTIGSTVQSGYTYVSSSTSAAFSGLSSANNYNVTVTATNSVGSTSGSCVVTNVTTPTAFYNGSVSGNNTSGFVLSWSGGIGNGITYTYLVTASGVTQSGYTVINNGSGTAAFSGLASGTAYNITITATNNAGSSSGSFTASTTAVATAPSAITGMSCGSATYVIGSDSYGKPTYTTGFTVSWSGGSGATSYSYSILYTPKTYSITYTPTIYPVSENSFSPTTSGATNSVTFTGLNGPLSGSWSVTVTATNSNGSTSNTITGCKGITRYIIYCGANSGNGGGTGNDNNLVYSTDGINWSGGGLFPGSDWLYKMASSGYNGNGILMGLFNSGAIRTTSGTNAINAPGGWTSVTTTTSINSSLGINISFNVSCSGLAYGNSTWVMLAANGYSMNGTGPFYGLLYSRNNGSTWTKCSINSGTSITMQGTGSYATLADIVYGGGYFVVPSNSPNIYYSSDGITFNATSANGYASNSTSAGVNYGVCSARYLTGTGNSASGNNPGAIFSFRGRYQDGNGNNINYYTVMSNILTVAGPSTGAQNTGGVTGGGWNFLFGEGGNNNNYRDYAYFPTCDTMIAGSLAGYQINGFKSTIYGLVKSAYNPGPESFNYNGGYQYLSYAPVFVNAGPITEGMLIDGCSRPASDTPLVMQIFCGQNECKQPVLVPNGTNRAGAGNSNTNVNGFYQLGLANGGSGGTGNPACLSSILW